MSGDRDFEIWNGVLNNYTGPGGDVTIPEGVTVIDSGAFENCTGLTSVVIPEGVTEIGCYAFSGCTSLQSITIPGSVRAIGTGSFKGYSGPISEGITVTGKSPSGDYNGLTNIPVRAFVTRSEGGAFYGCTNLTSITIPAGVTKIGEEAFYGCTSLTSVTIPEGVTEIGRSAFDGCANLTSITIPAGVTKIGEEAFYDCANLTSVTIPAGVTEIGEGAFSDTSLTKIDLPCSIRVLGGGDYGEDIYQTIPEGLLQTADKLNATIAVQIRDVWHKQMSMKDWAWVYLFQTSKAFQELCGKHMKTAPADECLTAMLEILEGCEKSGAYVQAAGYAVDHLKEVSPESIQALYDMAAAGKYKKALELLELLVKNKSKAPAAGDPYAFLREAFNETMLLKDFRKRKGVDKDIGGVKLKDSGKKAPPFVTLCAILPYAIQYQRPAHISGYQKDYIRVEPVEQADQAAALLDHDSLMKALTKCVSRNPAWYVPYCRYASGGELKGLISKLSAWADWYSAGAAGRSNIMTVRGALMLSDTREAMLYLDKGGHLNAYAKLRGINADTLRDTVLAEFGLDEKGEKVYDPGASTVTVTLAQDLTLSIFDGNAGKAVKSIPKKGADPEKYEAAKADFAEMKKNVKKVVKARVDQLFARFLSGESMDGEAWQKSYLNNPVLRQAASLLVWSQDGRTFTLRDGAAIDSGEQPYAISGKPIQVAHPMEMKSGDVLAWQKYFNDHGIKQPFAQVWEPVIRSEAVKEGRYSGIQIPAYRFKGKEKHGISFHFDYGLSALEISLSECNLEYDSGDAVQNHYLELDGLMTLGKFTFQKYTRQVNHIVALLDQWTIIGRIMKDDAAVVALLDSATLAQIMEYINISTENRCVNVTAELLNYKNEHFPGFDPLAEFTLDNL